jgi:hypothetical protein
LNVDEGVGRASGVEGVGRLKEGCDEGVQSALVETILASEEDIVQMLTSLNVLPDLL